MWPIVPPGFNARARSEGRSKTTFAEIESGYDSSESVESSGVRYFAKLAGLGPALGEPGCDIWRFRGLLGP